MNRSNALPSSTFRSVTIVLPVLNETRSLEQTVQVIRNTCNPDDIEEYLIVVCDRTTPEALAVCHKIQSALNGGCRIHYQRLPFIGGAMREAFDLANGSHVIMMSSDLETDPHVVHTFIERAREMPDAIITSSRWIQGGRFIGYNRVKWVANYTFQKLLSLMYWTRLTDLTFAFRIFPTKLVQAIDWRELKHPFFLETVIKPLRLGVQIVETPAVWRARTEGESQNPFLSNFAYFKIALTSQFGSPDRFLRNSDDGKE